MGIDIEEQYKCYVLEHSMLQSEEYAMDINGNADQIRLQRFVDTGR